jgi:hypothetical protein
LKFVHISDVHIGSFREPELNNLSLLSFSNVIDYALKEKVAFVLISGDLFNTALPDINQLKIVTEKLKLLKDNDIECYVIAGSHDYSPTGKTMLDVLESAGLIVNVVCASRTQNNKLQLQFTADKKTGVKISGMLGKKGGLESEFYKDIDFSNLIDEKGFKIFMFHSTISELKPKDLAHVESSPISILPKGFDYYAGGHVHIVKEAKYGNGVVVYPGPVYPCNFKELEELSCGGFYVVDLKSGIMHTEYHKINIFETLPLKIDADNKTPRQVELEILDYYTAHDVSRKIILIRVEGELSSGKSTDVNFSFIIDTLMGKGAYYVLKNTSKMTSKEFKEVEVSSTENVEEDVITKNINQIKLEGFDSGSLVKELVHELDDERQDGETVSMYEKRILEKMDKIFKI